MKKTTAIGLCFALALFLISCSKKDPFYEKACWDTNECAGVTAIVESSSSTGITISLKNETNVDFWPSGWGHIQVCIPEGKDKHDAWYEVKMKKDEVSPSETDTPDDEFIINWTKPYGELPEGYDYRIAVFLESDTAASIPISTWAYFSIR